MQAFTVGATDLKALLAALRSLGLDADALAKSVELPPNALDDTSARFPEATMLRLWLAAESSFGKAGLGVHAGSSISFGELELLDYLVGSNATVGDGFRAMARYAALGDTGLTYVIDDGGTGDVTISMRHPYAFQILPASLVEYFWTIIVTRFRLYAGGDFTPSLDLSHARTGPLALYQKVLGRVRFDAERTLLRISRDQWNLEGKSGSPRLRAILERHASDLLERVLDAPPVDPIRRALVESLGRGEIGIAQVASRLSLTPRTLQRRLAAEGQSFKEALDEVRRELSRVYLRETRLSLTEVCYLLGYSDPSAFNRAFRRWTGVTPLEFRNGSGEVRGTSLPAVDRAEVGE
jgi:AraC-like DNA-binding protein